MNLTASMARVACDLPPREIVASETRTLRQLLFPSEGGDSLLRGLLTVSVPPRGCGRGDSGGACAWT